MLFRSAEELNDYLIKNGVRSNYIHSDVETMDRIQIMSDLRAGLYDVIVGVNLLREGLDLPEVSLVAIIDADKEGFLRDRRSLTQTAGRAARNINGRVILYADKMTESMRLTIQETNRRREKQMVYNKKNHITPKQIQKAITSSLLTNSQQNTDSKKKYGTTERSIEAADPITAYMNKSQLDKAIAHTRKQMQEAAERMDFLEAAQYRDELFKLEAHRESKRQE